MPIVMFVVYMNNGEIKTVYTKNELQLLEGQYKKVIKKVFTSSGWKEVLL